MGHYQRDTVFILAMEPYREHDAWITGYSKQSGKIQAIARGVRRVGAKQLGHLEPLQFADVMLAKGKAYDHIAVARAQGPILKSRHRLGQLLVLKAFADAIDRLTQPGSHDPALFAFIQEVVRSWEQIDQEVSAIRGEFALMTALLRVLDLLGIAPPMNECASCRTMLGDDVYMIPRQGVLICKACFQTHRHEFVVGYPLMPSTRKMLVFLLNASYQHTLSLSAPVDCVTQANQVIMDCLHHAPMQGVYRGHEYLRILS